MGDNGPIIMRPLDACVEWLVKGVNIGLYYSLFYAKREIPQVNITRSQYYISFASFTLKQCMLFRGILGTWQFITHATANARKIEDPLNFAIGSMFTLIIWHIPLKIPSNKLFLNSIFVGAVGFALGKISLTGE